MSSVSFLHRALYSFSRVYCECVSACVIFFFSSSRGTLRMRTRRTLVRVAPFRPNVHLSAQDGRTQQPKPRNAGPARIVYHTREGNGNEAMIIFLPLIKIKSIFTSELSSKYDLPPPTEKYSFLTSFNFLNHLNLFSMWF